jgi:hypothetical protein
MGTRETPFLIKPPSLGLSLPVPDTPEGGSDVIDDGEKYSGKMGLELNKGKVGEP